MRMTRKMHVVTIVLCFASAYLWADEPTELKTLRAQHDKAVEQVQLEAKAKEKRLNEQYLRSLDLLMQSLTRSGKLDAALAVRAEKAIVAEAIGIPVPPEGDINKLPNGLSKPSVPPGSNKIVEGEGWRGFRVGATRDELIKELGKPDNDPMSRWLQWKKKHYIHCLVDDTRGAFELRFDPGFKGETVGGIHIGSSEVKLLQSYGEPDHILDIGNGSKKLEYSKKGVLFWTRNGKVNQIVVFRIY